MQALGTGMGEFGSNMFSKYTDSKTFRCLLRIEHNIMCLQNFNNQTF